MKTTVLSFLLSFCVVMASAQTFSLTPKVSSGYSASTGSYDLFSNMKNNSTSDADSMFKWKAIKYSGAGFEKSICDPNNCYTLPPIGSSYDFKLKKGASGEFKVTYSFAGTGGWDTMKVAVESVATPPSYDTITFIMNAWLTGLKEAYRSAEVSFYPNPVKDVLNFKYATSGSVNVEIYSILGVKVKSFTHDGGITQVNTTDLKNGVYFIRLKDGGRMISKSFNKAE